MKSVSVQYGTPSSKRPAFMGMFPNRPASTVSRGEWTYDEGILKQKTGVVTSSRVLVDE